MAGLTIDTIPGIELNWPYGDDNWNVGMDADILYFAVMNNLTIINNTTTVPPASPAVGDTYIVGAGGAGVWSTRDNQVTVYWNGKWNFIVPKIGQHAKQASDLTVGWTWTGTEWFPDAESYVSTFETRLAYQELMNGLYALGVVNSPTSTYDGNIFIVSDSPTDAFTGHEKQVARYEVDQWKFYAARRGQRALVANGSGVDQYWFDGVTWVML